MTGSSPLYSFIPPYILNRIIAHGSDRQRSSAQTTLSHVRRYDTLCDTLCDKRLSSEATFSAFAQLTVEHARQGLGATAVEAVRHGWSEVGVDLTLEEQ